jgi:hypothetical protein
MLPYHITHGTGILVCKYVTTVFRNVEVKTMYISIKTAPITPDLMA